MRLFSLLVLVSSLAASAEWTRFRGPNGTGVSDERGLPEEVGRDRNVVWKIKTFKGNSSPVVSGDRLWITGHEGNERVLFCYSTADGSLLWRKSIPKTHNDSPNPVNGPTTPTPVVGGNSVFAFIPEFGLIAFDFDGKQRWTAPLGPFGGVQGMATSPVYADGKVLLLIDTPEEAHLAAFDAETGKQDWKAERPVGFLGSYATPAIYHKQVVVAGAVELTGYDLATGKRQWWVRGVTTAPAHLPLIADEAVFTMEPSGNGAPPFQNMAANLDKDKNGKVELSELTGDRTNDKIMYRLFKSIDKVSGNGDGVVTADEFEHAFNPAEPGGGLVRIKLSGEGDVTRTNVVWRYTKGLPYLAAPLLYDGILYVIKDGGILSTFDPKDGHVLREERLKDAIGDYYAQPVAGDGKIYFVNKDGKLSIVRAGKNWELLSSADFDEQVIATPAIAGGRLFLRTEEALYCFGQKKPTAD